MKNQHNFYLKIVMLYSHKHPRKFHRHVSVMQNQLRLWSPRVILNMCSLVFSVMDDFVSISTKFQIMLLTLIKFVGVLFP